MLLLVGFALQGLAFALDLYRVPVSVAMVLLTYALYQFSHTDHFFRLNPRRPAKQATAPPAPVPELRDVARNWRLPETSRDGEGSRRCKTLVVVTASGGGIQATAWTCRVLVGLHQRYGDPFTRSVGLISAVSGGSVGALYYLDHWQQTGPPLPPADGAPWVNNLPVPGTLCAQAMASSLEATAWGLAFPDLLRVVLPWAVPKTHDRGAWIEEAWRDRLLHPDARLTDWTRPVLEGAMPIPVFNATIVETGQRFLAAPVRGRVRPGTPPAFQARELLELYPDAETLAGAVYEHAPDSEVKAPLQRFLAVISNLYRSFLSRAKRNAVDVPPSLPMLPPLASFKQSGDFGPFTIPADGTRQLFGSDIGVVSLPSTYRDHPVLWAALAHETGGHDVLHADPELLPELAGGVRDLFGGGTVRPGRSVNLDQFYGLLWSYWIDETASDVYGLLNIGPQFAFNLAAFFAALNGPPIPSLRTVSGFDPRDPSQALDVHPTDILRLDVAIGVIEQQVALSASARTGYAAALETVADLCAHGATAIVIRGKIEIDRDHFLPVNVTRPLDEMRQNARKVGAFVATAKLDAFGGKSVQDIETWDDSDEETAGHIAKALADGRPVVDLGDDAQLLAGATQALLADPGLYDRATQALADALDRSFMLDPIWGPPLPEPMFIRYGGRGAALPELRYTLAVEAAPKAAKKARRKKAR